MKNFPYKHLIWAVVAVIAMFVFREAWLKLFVKVEKVDILGKVTVEVDQGEAELLFEAEKQHKEAIHKQLQLVKDYQNSLEKAYKDLLACQDSRTEPMMPDGVTGSEELRVPTTKSSTYDTTIQRLRKSYTEQFEKTYEPIVTPKKLVPTPELEPQ